MFIWYIKDTLKHKRRNSSLYYVLVAYRLQKLLSTGLTLNFGTKILKLPIVEH